VLAGQPHEAAASHLVKPLLRRFDDASERCRELAASCTLQTLRSGPDHALALLPYVMPVLEERLQRKVGLFVEPLSLHMPALKASQSSVCILHAAALKHAQHPFANNHRQPTGPVEPSEEVRLTLTHLLRVLISQVGNASPIAHACSMSKGDMQYSCPCHLHACCSS